MARLAVTHGCRFHSLLAEFGEESAPCGKCDHCRGGPLALPRREGALTLGWRIALTSRLADLSADAVEYPEPDPPAAEPPVVGPTPDRAAPMTVADERLLRALQAERSAIARRRSLPLRRVASDGALRDLATSRPRQVDDPLFNALEEPAAFLRVIGRHIGEE